MANITLTEPQIKRMEEYRDEWYKVNLTTERCDRKKTEIAITRLYEVLKLKTPKFHWFESPLAAQEVMNKELGNDSKQYIPTSLLGNQDAYWVAFYLFCREINVEFTEEQSKILDIWKETALHGGWWYAFDTDVFCIERPTGINFNERGQLDNAVGPAIAYSDGWRLYAVRGVPLPGWIIEKPDTITVDAIDKEENIEIQRIMQDRMGIAKYLEASGASLVHMDMVPVGGLDEDKWMPRALMRDKQNRQFLVGTDSSTQEKVFYMQVDPNAKTCSEAHKSISGIEDKDIIVNA